MTKSRSSKYFIDYYARGMQKCLGFAINPWKSCCFWWGRRKKKSHCRPLRVKYRFQCVVKLIVSFVICYETNRFFFLENTKNHNNSIQLFMALNYHIENSERGLEIDKINEFSVPSNKSQKVARIR